MKTLKFTISFFIFIFSGTGYCLGSKPIMESPEEKRLKKKKIDKERELNKLRSSFKTLETENQRKKKALKIIKRQLEDAKSETRSLEEKPNEIAKLKENLSALNKEHNGLQTKLSGMKTQSYYLNKKIKLFEYKRARNNNLVASLNLQISPKGEILEKEKCPPNSKRVMLNGSIYRCIGKQQPCSLANGVGTQYWEGQSWGACIVSSCRTGYAKNSSETACERSCPAGRHIEFKDGKEMCLSNKRLCSVSNGGGEQSYSSGSWGSCLVTKCNFPYKVSSNKRYCVKGSM